MRRDLRLSGRPLHEADRTAERIQRFSLKRSGAAFVTSDPTPSEEEGCQRLRRQGGAWLKQMREAAGLTQLDLATRLEVSNKSFVSQVEVGHRTIPMDRFVAWADALRLDHRRFARQMLAFYEPSIFRMLFDDEQP